MNWRKTKPLELIRFDDEPSFSVGEWLGAARGLLADGSRPVALFSQEMNSGRRVWAVFTGRSSGQLCVTNTVFSPDARQSYPALSLDHPCMQYFECELYEQTGLLPEGHPWLRPVRLADSWRHNGEPYTFYQVEGEEVHEVAVGPVHAGVIEPGHFRFQCHGEEILNLEIQLGYQHRGIEKLIAESIPGGSAGSVVPPWRDRQLVLAESISGDSVIAHATAFCSAIEALAGVSPALREQAVRGVAAELERIAMHLSSLGGIATDIGFALPSAALGALRTSVINLTAEICGSRFGRGWIIPGGVRFDLEPPLIEKARHVLGEVLAKFLEIESLLFNAPSALARMEETGIVSKPLAIDAGLAGLAARASGVACDVRTDFPYGIYRYSSIPSLTFDSCDVYGRAKLRALEIRDSIRFIFEQIDNLPGPKAGNSPTELAKNAFTIALTEGHRGEIVHILFTDAAGRISKVKIKDPSFHNWQGLALAVRENGISDFPLCNKSFDLSYAGHDL